LLSNSRNVVLTNCPSAKGVNRCKIQKLVDYFGTDSHICNFTVNGKTTITENLLFYSTLQFGPKLFSG